MSYLLFPGRHIVNTRFQEEYLFSVLKRPIESLPISGDRKPTEPLTDVIFAVTSSNQQNSRYNPVPFHVRAIGVDRFGRDLQASLKVGFWIVGIPHFGNTDRFAEFTLKEITEQTEGELELTPDNTVVMASTPSVIAMYRALGFSVLTAERQGDGFAAPLPVDVVSHVAEAGAAWPTDASLRKTLSGATWSLFAEFPEIPRRIHRLFRDPLLNDHGSLTENRNYSTYARAMDAIIDLKLAEIRPGIRQGKIVDEGCADGALLTRLAATFPDSDLIGIDIASEFIARCRERQRAGEFGGSYVYFHQRNLLEPIFEAGSIDTTICNSTLHELWSYGGGEATVRRYFGYKFDQTAPGGRLVIRDVVGFAERKRQILMTCRDDDGSNDGIFDAHPAELSTHARFKRFARDFTGEVPYEETPQGFVLAWGDAMEFLTKKDYVDNWDSEMNETFCFWSFDEWKAALADAGFAVLENPNDPESGSRTYLSQWRVEHHFKGKVAFYGLDRTPLPYPATNVVLIAEKSRLTSVATRAPA